MRDKIIFFISILLILGGVYAFFIFFESYEEETDKGFSLKAKKNPYLAAELFLNANSINVNSDIATVDFSTLDTNTTLFIADINSVLLTTTKIDTALDWVDRGGFLIGGINNDDSPDDSLLERFGLQTISNSLSDIQDENLQKLSERLRELNEEDKSDNSSDTYEETPKKNSFSSTVEMSFEGVEDTLVVSFPNFIALDYIDEANTDDIFYIAESDAGIHLAQANYGNGNITFLSYASIWQSKNIGENDNAYLLALLAGEGYPFHILYNIRRDSLWQLLKKFALEVIISALALIFIWLWHKSIRTGKIIAPPTAERRAFTDHIMAISEFHMAGKNQHLLLNAVKNSIFYEFDKRDHQFNTYDLQTKASLIAKLTQLDEQHIYQWLLFFDEPNDNQVAFIQQMKIANTIRKQL